MQFRFTEYTITSTTVYQKTKAEKESPVQVSFN